MRISSRFAVLLAACAFALPARALDLTGIWYDPAVPGRGLSVHEQAGTTFAILYTYDATGKGIFYVASDVRSNGINFDPCGTALWSGRLYEASGPALGGSTPPLATRDVGTLSYSSATSPSCESYNRLAVSTTIDGVTANFTYQRQTFGTETVEGQYVGWITRTAPGCDQQTLEMNGPIVVARSGSRLSIGLTMTPGVAFCVFEGEARQVGNRQRVEGMQACRVGPFVSDRPFVMVDLVADANGFSGVMTYPGTPSCGTARIGGARRFTP